tara:strand:- start:221 stop:841 length:621 start_codon:yes stop_codon:yes gene_type:complete
MEPIISLLIILLGGYFLRLSLISSGQAWAKSYAQTVSFFLLPIITYVITKVIYGNIALSLGMIGALSIVRFRHPVKSALELIIYFNLITIGIASSVNNLYAAILVVLSISIIYLIKYLQNFFTKDDGSTFYNISFNEGIEYNKLEITSSVKIDEIEKNNNLKSIIHDTNTKEFFYRLSFENKNKLKSFKERIENIDGINKIDVNFI